MWTFVKQDEPVNGLVICYFEKLPMTRTTGIESTTPISQEILDGMVQEWEIEDAAELVAQEAAIQEEVTP